MSTTRNDRGMTLAEVIIAIAILTIGLVALMGAFTAGYLDLIAGGGQSQATAFARQRLELLKNTPFNPPLNPAPPNGSNSPAPGVNVTWTITPVAGTAIPNMVWRIVVQASWRAGTSGVQTVTLETMRAQGS